jgi:hypothetical protein
LNVKDTIYNFVDGIFNPPISFLNMAIEKLRGIQMVMAQGINVGKYLSIFGDMPTSWQLVISSILISCVLLGTLLMVRSIIRLYYAVKDGVQWW